MRHLRSGSLKILVEVRNEQVIVIFGSDYVAGLRTTCAGEGDDAHSREPLKGISEMGVEVVSESCTRRGHFAASLKNEAELQLRMVGIKVWSDSTNSPPARLRVRLLCYELRSSEGYSFSQQ